MVMAACLLLASTVKGKWAAFAIMSLMGIPWATTMVLPFTIVGKLAGKGNESGLVMGVFNLFVVIPQLFVSAFLGFYIRMFDNDLASALGLGGVMAFLAGGLVFRLIVEEEEEHVV